jgi:hypothetical protein
MSTNAATSPGLEAAAKDVGEEWRPTVAGAWSPALLQQQPADKDPDHDESERNLQGHANRESYPRGGSGASCPFPVGVHGQLTHECADERTDENSWQAEHQAGERSERRAGHGAPARAEALDPDGRCDEINDVAHRANDTDHRKRPRSDTREVIGARRQQQAEEDEDMARQRRHDDSDETDEDQSNAERPQKNRHVIAALNKRNRIRYGVYDDDLRRGPQSPRPSGSTQCAVRADFQVVS